MNMHPVHAFNMYDDEVHVEPVSSGVTVTEPDETALSQGVRRDTWSGSAQRRRQGTPGESVVLLTDAPRG
ncbi:hypothetical protein CRV15_21270 [Streptomyces clavuligerus]|uniref:Uncharacterized protein n=1 Tax=Streptomyces clavuligerus TaxID=1901 RepID=B5GV28_STRCL|nr:hypothetical protein D1794_21905 [Streptomyces clavuligerus]EDY50174.1 hypothetical protein SSCG_03163 [Streptomyces clavuligerus]EFG06496.1 Hypothetical protein SCLAV_1417 [Streptomyces clavuligerus]QCS07919.1 hypothetical protein CRV15_21270 [Streptomyces clavuligerus]QPJ92744.1 hypothetical protein GE265_06825 [Streptomyces clavuligerus]